MLLHVTGILFSYISYGTTHYAQFRFNTSHLSVHSFQCVHQQHLAVIIAAWAHCQSFPYLLHTVPIIVVIVMIVVNTINTAKSNLLSI